MIRTTQRGQMRTRDLIRARRAVTCGMPVRLIGAGGDSARAWPARHRDLAALRCRPREVACRPPREAEGAQYQHAKVFLEHVRLFLNEAD
jgi:hypothetical protein